MKSRKISKDISNKLCKTIKLRDEVIPYIPERREIKYPRLEFKTGRLLVVLPKKGYDEEDLLRKKSKWILTKYKEIQGFLKEKETEENVIPIFGERFRIRPRGSEVCVDLASKSIQVDLADPVQRKLLLKKLKECLRKKILEFVSQFSKDLDIHFNKIFIKSQKTKWGSCSQKGNLNFNIKLVFLPLNLVKYVVLHEVMHLKEKRHNIFFWSLVSNYFKDYKLLEKQLGKYWFSTEKIIQKIR